MFKRLALINALYIIRATPFDFFFIFRDSRSFEGKKIISNAKIIYWREGAREKERGRERERERERERCSKALRSLYHCYIGFKASTVTKFKTVSCATLLALPKELKLKWMKSYRT